MLLYHALISSPLGPILLESDGTGLSGLYFTDQRDLPHVDGLETAAQVVSDPSAGVLDGRSLRTLRAIKEVPSGETGQLFPADPVPAHAQPRWKEAPLRWLQDTTPANAKTILEQARQALEEYWDGTRQTFDLPLTPRGTAFQQRIWQALLEVPCGEVLSYGELALRAGLSAGHGRAAGTAVGSNPISIIIPCHRILARNGTLNGYGGGLERKLRLLELEGFTIQG